MKTLIIVTTKKGVNRDHIFREIAARLSMFDNWILNPKIAKRRIKLENIDCDIIFVPAELEHIKGYRPDYILTDSYEASDYFMMHDHTKELGTVKELIEVIFKLCNDKFDEYWREVGQTPI